MARWLDEGAKSYYKRVELFLDGTRGEGDELFLKNVLQQVISDGTCRVCCDKDGSRAIERLLRDSVVDVLSLQNLTEALIPECPTLAQDRCGSHVLEALMKTAAGVIAKQEDKALYDSLEVLICNLKGHIAEFVAHPYASHVLSMALQVLAGSYCGDEVCRSKYSQEFRKAKLGGSQSGVMVAPVPTTFNKLLDSFAKKICKLDGLDALVKHKCANPVFQVLLKVLDQRLPERRNKFIRKIIKSSQVFDNASTTLPGVFTDVVGSHLMEAVLEVASSDLQEHVYDSCFRGKVMRFACHPVANYPLQKLLTSATPPLVSLLADELSVEEVLFAGHSGVVVRLTQALLACPPKQPAHLAALLQAFHVEAQPKLCAPLFLALTAYEVYFTPTNEEEKQQAAQPSTHGSLLVQALLQFEEPKLVARSLLKMPSDDMVGLSCDPSGSHVIDAFMSSPTVSRKLKSKLIAKLKLRLCELSCSRHGSRVVEVVWRHSEVGCKQGLAQELLEHEEQLKEDFFGKIVLRNCNITHYKSKQAAWKLDQVAADRTRELFKDVVSGEGSSNPGRTRKHKTKLPLFDSDGEENLPCKRARKL